MPIELLSGGLGKLIGAVIRAATSDFVGRVKRLKAVNAAIDANLPFSSPTVQIAVRDLETVLGGYRGDLTDSMAAFLADLRDSGIVVAMCEAEMCEADPPGVKAAFRNFYSRHWPDEKDFIHADQIYFKFRRAFAASAAGLASSDPSWYIRAHQGLAQQVLSKVDDRLSEMFQHGLHKLGSDPSSPILSSSNARDLTKVVARSLQRSVELIWVMGPDSRSKPVKINDIYVPLPTIEWSDFHQARQTAVDIVNISRLVILGNPGSGKSTLSQRLCFDYLQQSQDGEGSLAIRILIRDFEKATVTNSQLSLVDFLISSVTQVCTLPHPTVESLLRHLLTYGQVVLILDGLDEILQIGSRRHFVDLVETALQNYPLCRCIVTSRFVGYHKAPLKHFSAIRMQPLARDDVARLIRRLWSIVDLASFGDADETIERFITHTRHVADLTENPLLLTMMIWLFRDLDGKIPASRANVYQECAELLFKRWDRDRKIYPDLPEHFDLFHLLKSLADVVYEDRELRSGFSKSWLRDFVERFFLEYFVSDSRSRAVRAAEQVFEYLLDRSWVLSEVGLGNYNFTHLTFLEYFFAMKLDDDFASSPKEMLRRHRQKILNGQWSIPLHIALNSLVGLRRSFSKEVTSALLRILVNSKELSALEASSFAFEALEYLTGSEREILAISIASADCRTRVIPKLDKSFAERALLWASPLSRYSFLNRGTVCRGYAESLFGVVKNGTDQDLAFIADALQLARMYTHFKVTTTNRDSPWLAFIEIDTAMQSVTKGRRISAKPDPTGRAKAIFDITGLLPGKPAELIRNEGLALWEFALGRGKSRLNWIVFDLMLTARILLSGANSIRDVGLKTIMRSIAQAVATSGPFDLPGSENIVLPSGDDLASVTLSLVETRLPNKDQIVADFVISAIAQLAKYSGVRVKDGDEDSYAIRWRAVFSAAEAISVEPIRRQRRALRFLTL